MTNINTFPGDTQGRNILKSRTITHGVSSSGEVDTYTLNPGENLIILNNAQGTTGSSRTYAANFTAGIPTALGTVLHLEINSSRTNNSSSQVIHRTAIQFGGTAYLDTGNIAVYATGNAQDAYQRKLQRTIVLTVSGWVDFSLGSRIGTVAAATDIIFQTNDNVGQAATGSDIADVERMRIRPDGNVGIGTASPGEKLVVHENISTSGHQIIARIGGHTSSFNTLVFGSLVGKPHVGGHRGDYGAWADLSLQNDTMVLRQGTGVGIGTTIPKDDLHIFEASGGQTTGLFIEKQNGASGTAQITFGVAAGNEGSTGKGKGGIFFERTAGNGRGELHFCVDSSSDNNGVALSDVKMAITNAGAIGIGTATPQVKLHVKSASVYEGLGIVNPAMGLGGTVAFGSGCRGGILVSNGGGGSDGSDAYSSQPLVMNGGGTGATDGNLRGGSIWSAWGGAQYGIAIRGANSGAAVPHGASEPNMFITDNTVGIGLNGPTSKLSIVGNYSNSQAPTTYNSAPSLNVVFNSGADFVPICQFRSNTGITNVQENGIFHKRGNGHTMGLKTSSGHVLFRNETTQKQMQLHTNGTLYINCNARAPSFTNESDDRIKYNESGVKNAIQTLFKLKPQTYEKGKMEIDILEHQEYINTANKEGYEWNNIEDAWIKRQTDLTVKREAGLMAQDIWYDAPELRHMVVLPEDATPDDTKPSEPEPGNIRVDPDYDSAGWGKLASAGVDYNSLIPYLIKSIKELYYEVPRYKTSVSTEIYSNVQDYHNMIVCRSGENIQFTNTGNDKTVHGVISDIKTDTDNYELLIEHSGLGNAWVINTGSTINAGDYITTSNVTGYGMLQDSAFCMNYTLAKSTIECDFTLQTTPIKQKIRRLQDKTYWIKTEALLDCSLMAYSNLSNDIRTTQMETYYDVYENKNTSSNVVEQHTRQYTIDNEVPTQLTESEMNWGHFSNTFAFNTPFNTGAQTRIKYLRKQISKIGNEIGGYEPIVEQELMDVLDENGQVQWEDTGETRALHELRYLTVDGSITDQSNAVYTSSLLPVVLLL